MCRSGRAVGFRVCSQQFLVSSSAFVGLGSRAARA